MSKIIVPDIAEVERYRRHNMASIRLDGTSDYRECHIDLSRFNYVSPVRYIWRKNTPDRQRVFVAGEKIKPVNVRANAIKIEGDNLAGIDVEATHHSNGSIEFSIKPVYKK